MSQNYGAVPPSTTTGTGSTSGTTETAKQEASEVAGTAKAEAGHVLDTAKQEASTVAREAKTQAKQVYAQTKRELSDQAATQQQRVADGLRSIGDELQSLARNSENGGVATDLVRQASTKLTDVSSWLSERDPGSLLDEVKTFARRKPGLFIGGALVAGVLAGRLARALGESAADERSATAGTSGTVPPPAPVTGTGVGASTGYGAGGYSPGTAVGTGVGAGVGAGAVGTGAGTAGSSTAGTGTGTGEWASGEGDDPATAHTVDPAFGSGVSDIRPTPQGGQPVTSTGAAGESTPLYDDSHAANPAAEPGFEGLGEPHDGR